MTIHYQDQNTLVNQMTFGEIEKTRCGMTIKANTRFKFFEEIEDVTCLKCIRSMTIGEKARRRQKRRIL